MTSIVTMENWHVWNLIYMAMGLEIIMKVKKLKWKNQVNSFKLNDGIKI